MFKPTKNRKILLHSEQFEQAQFGQNKEASVVGYHFSKARVETLCMRYFQLPGTTRTVKKAYNTAFVWIAIRKIAEREFIQHRKLMHNNFGLTETGFNKLVDALKADSDTRLYEEIFLHHFEACLLFLKKKYRIAHHDAYDATMETLLEFGKRLRDGRIKYGNLRFLFTQMAGQIYLRKIRKDPPTEELYKIEIQEEPEYIEDRTLIVLDKAWNELGVRCKELLKRHYYKGINLQLVAEEYEQSAAATRKQKQRCVEKLRKLFIQFY